MDDQENLPTPPGIVEGLTYEEREEQFFRLLSEGCKVVAAANAVAISWANLYRKRKFDPEFAKRWEDARRIEVKHLEEEAFRRAKNGSDKLLMFLLERRDPEKYGHRQEVTHRGGVNLSVFTGIPAPGSGVDDLV